MSAQQGGDDKQGLHVALIEEPVVIVVASKVRHQRKC